MTRLFKLIALSAIMGGLVLLATDKLIFQHLFYSDLWIGMVLGTTVGGLFTVRLASRRSRARFV